MKLSKAPNMRTVIIAVLAFILIGTAVDAFARELRVTTYADLARCAGTVVAGTRVIAAGPDAGQTSAAGDTCVVFPGIYPAADVDVDGDPDPIYVTLENITIRSSNGATATSIIGAGIVAGDTTDPDGPGAIPPTLEVGVIIVMADGVTIGGPKSDQGLAIQGVAPGIPAGVSGIAIGPGGTPAGMADENITVQQNIIRANGLVGIVVFTAGSLELFKFQDNIIRENPLGGIIYAPTVASIGRRGADRNIVISRNYIANNALQVAFLNTGTAEQVAVVENKIQNEGLPFPLGVLGLFFANAGEVRNSLIGSNTMQNHVVAGALFVNTGRVDTVDIVGNRGTTPQQGITFNGLVGMLFLRLPGFGVTEIRDVNVTDNTINSNGFLGGIMTFFVPGFAGGDVESFNLVNNNIRQNAGPGFSKLFGSDFTRSNFEGNTFRNNGVAGFITLHGISRFSENSFTRNDFRENGGVGLAVLALVPPATGDIDRVSMTGNTYVKNTLFGYLFATDAGDIASFDINGDESVENGPGVLAPPFGGSGCIFVTNALPFPGIFAGAGDIEDISGQNGKCNNNGGFGMTIQSLAPVLPTVAANRGDINAISFKNFQFNHNGTRAPVGLGSGLQLAAESVREVALETVQGDNNNDHGVQLTASRDLAMINIANSEFNNNDRNVDTVGNGIDISVNEAGSDVTISNVKANSNNSGIRISSQDRIGRNYTIEKSEINDNRDSGVDLFSGEDLDTIAVKQNTLARNAIGVRVDVEDRGSRIEITENKITGDNGTGVGVLINSVGVKVEKNSIRRNATGIEVRKQRDNQIVNNNIARNENFGVDAMALSPGVTIDAKNNWWGEPSGPKHATNPNGIGDRVTDRVDFMPFLGEPAVPTEDLFQVLSLTASDTDVAVGDSVTFKYTIKNNGTEEGTQEVTVVIKDGLGNVVNQFSRQITVNQGASRDDTFSFIFTVSGEYTVTVSTPDDSKSVTVTVAGEAACLPFALDTNKNKVLDDAEIITSIDLWVKNGDVPGCSPPKKIGDTQIIQLIDLWVKGSQLTVPLGGKVTAMGRGDSRIAPTGQIATLATSVRTVRPGDSFVVTVTVDAKDGISGLLLSQVLPAGWSVKPLQMSGAYFKASENKWLWLNAKGTVSVSYEVTVPATAQPGVYTIAGRAKAAVPGIEAELQPLAVEVLGAPVALAVKAITLSQQPVRTSGAYFVVEGVGIAQTTVRVFGLTGKLVFAQTAQGNVVPFSAASELANGVYLYVVTVQGADGQTVTSSIAKLVVLR